MAPLQISDLPENIYRQLEQQAREIGVTVAKCAAMLLARAVEEEEREQHLLAEIRREREELARKGVYATQAIIDEAKRWGRK